MLIKSLVAVFLAAILTENYVLCKFLGICPFLGVSKKLNTAFGMSVAVTFVMVLATAVTFPIYTYVLVPAGIEYLQTVLFILIIAGLGQLVEIVLKKYIPGYNKTGDFLEKKSWVAQLSTDDKLNEACRRASLLGPTDESYSEIYKAIALFVETVLKKG